ncbi:hypothetical protein CA235_09720 [Sphingomonas sp. ABOLF]|uniref:hypothetical protein n=1 Tax=Sphingomonas sp. ABOLF TaxID=1985879 RepID=UPI000F7DE7A8|nr:hypothetical protein [Sphingomonas sp. ABOLF]RSV15203.1 hypothetical protein CA235_09720 [Sphingomonas sp. ABOLF]
MTDVSSAKPSWKEVLSILCAVVPASFVIGGGLLSAGGRDKQLDENTRRIEALERADAAKTELLTKIDGRTIRIETKLEMMVPVKEARP